ncbi:MAG: bifunctional phosphoglucose/phosphomannose isomerase [Armatimonadota bacterium]|nr:bifunctional phosphoglucose/phosphomannose isomerase [Armatimonadota bacterium]
MILDDPREISRIDVAGMLQHIVQFGPMVREGWQAASALPPAAAVPSAVVVCGLGGSAISGDLLAALLAPSSPVPVVCVRDEQLPAFVGPRSLVIACSYSGHTEETLRAFETASRAGAEVVAITSGGRLADLAGDAGHAVVRVRPGLQPRASLPLLLLPMVSLAARRGLTPIDADDVRETAAVLDELAARWGPEVPSGDNPAKRLALALRGVIPAIYAASPSLEPVARRWKTQLNENSKTFAVANTFPELVHNEVVGWQGLSNGSPAVHVVVLRDRDEDPRAVARVAAARDVAFRGARGVSEVWSHGTSPLARLLSLVLFGDLVSGFLAVLAGVDPTPVEVITRIKDRLRSG